jgi:hypothetical protein
MNSFLLAFEARHIHPVAQRVFRPVQLRTKAASRPPLVKQAFKLLRLKTKATVHNYLGTIQFDCTVEKPSSIKELAAVMVKARKEKKKVRAVGAFHAWSYVIPNAFTP